MENEARKEADGRMVREEKRKQQTKKRRLVLFASGCNGQKNGET